MHDPTGKEILRRVGVQDDELEVDAHGVQVTPCRRPSPQAPWRPL